MPVAPDPSFGGHPTPPVTPRQKHRRSKTGRAHSHVPKGTPKKKHHALVNIPRLHYTRGPFRVPFKLYDFRFTAIRGDWRDTVPLPLVESASWDDSSAVMTGTLTLRNPDWARYRSIRDGHEILCECSEDGHVWKPLWRLRVTMPTRDFLARERSFTLVNDLNRLQQSDDNFTFVKGKGRAKGWRVDDIIRAICAKYDIEISSLPVMKAYITKWRLIDQQPLDVLHSALLREKYETGLRYVVSLDPQNKLHVTPFRRPVHLLELGEQLIAATYAATPNEKFATALTVRADGTTKVQTDKKGHKKITTQKIAVTLTTAAGVRLYGYIHRNVYSPDATTAVKARQEGNLFLAAAAKPVRQFQVSLPGLPFVRRLDAIRFKLPEAGLAQIVYVTEARHTIDGSGGYTTDIVLNFDDPFVDKGDEILSKLSDTAVTRQKQPPGTPKPKKKSKTRKAHTPAPPGLGGHPTPPDDKKPRVKL